MDTRDNVPSETIRNSDYLLLVPQFMHTWHCCWWSPGGVLVLVGGWVFFRMEGERERERGWRERMTTNRRFSSLY